MSKEEENILDLKNKEKFKIDENLETVPYLNNNSDSVQDILNKLESNTTNLQTSFFSKDNENIIDINFNKK